MKLTPSWKTLSLSLVAVFFLLHSCQKEQVSSSENIASSPAHEKISLLDWIHQGKIVSVLDLPEPKLDFSKLNKSKSSSRSANTSIQNQDLLLILEEHKERLERMINPDDFECGPTLLNDYILSTIEDFTQEDFVLVSNFGIIPFIEAIVFDDTRDEDFFGYEGDFTSSICFTFRDLKSFWDIPTDIQLSDAHGTVFQNVPLVAQILQAFFPAIDEEGNPIPVPDDIALAFAQELSDVFGSDKFDNYNHPLLTFNAIAFAGSPELGIPTKKIVMGDGIIEGYATLGLGSMAERFILAHEYGHQIQFAKNFPFEGTPESTRFTELMADAYGAYYSTHGRTALIQSLFLNRFTKTAFIIGDCAFDNPGHHGTPNQRARAAIFGGELAKKVGIVHPDFSSDEILELFTEAFPDLVVPDAE